MNDLQSIQQRIVDFTDAMVTGDVERLDELLAPSFLAMSAASDLPIPQVSREAFLAGMAEYRFNWASIEDASVRVYLNNAVVSLLWRQQALWRGLRRDGHFFITMTWVRQDYDWLLATHYTSRPTTTTLTPLDSAEPEVEEVLALEEAFTEAILAQDVDRLMSFFAPDARMISSRPDGPMTYTLDILRGYLERYTIRSAHASERQGQVVGDTAIVSQYWTQNGTWNGESHTGEYYHTKVWQRVDGTWRIAQFLVSQTSTRPLRATFYATQPQ